jgi:hypothetical protein
LAVGFIPGQGGVSYLPKKTPFGDVAPKGVIGGKLGETLAKGSGGGGGGSSPSPKGSGGGGGGSSPSPTPTSKFNPQTAQQAAEAKRLEAKARAEQERLRKANAESKLRGQLLSSSYRTKKGRVSASELNRQQNERTAQRKAYEDYKKLEYQTLAKSYNEAYKTYKSQGLSENQARYMAKNWQKARKEDIKASGGITTYTTKEIPQEVKP